MVKSADNSDFTPESILSVLSNPSFENSQPSWVRRSQHVHHIEDVDQPGKEGVKEKTEEIKTEFDGEDTEERALLTMVHIHTCTKLVTTTFAAALSTRFYLCTVGLI